MPLYGSILNYHKAIERELREPGAVEADRTGYAVVMQLQWPSEVKVDESAEVPTATLLDPISKLKNYLLSIPIILPQE